MPAHYYIETVISMEDGLTRIYIFNVSPLNGEHIFKKAYDSASFDRRKKADTFRNKSDKILCLGAELLLNFSLKNEGFDGQTEYVKGEYGKPYLKRNELFFNLSHSGEYVICAVSRHETGCDIEKMSKENMNVAKRFFHENEYSDICSVIPEKKMKRFFRYWTLKESFIKATGTGMSIPLNSFSISLGEKTEVNQIPDEKSYTFFEYFDIPGYCCAVCTVNNNEQFEVKEVKFGDIFR